MHEPGFDDEIPEGYFHIVKFKDWDCSLQRSTYRNGRIALQLNDITDGMPVATATVNVPEITIADDEVIIKNYAENEGMSAALMNAGIISFPVKSIRNQFVTFMVHKLIN